MVVTTRVMELFEQVYLLKFKKNKLNNVTHLDRSLGGISFVDAVLEYYEVIYNQITVHEYLKSQPPGGKGRLQQCYTFSNQSLVH